MTSFPAIIKGINSIQEKPIVATAAFFIAVLDIRTSQNNIKLHLRYITRGFL